jgi:hypothetical protein
MAKEEGKNLWKTLSREDIYENPWIKLEEHQVINPGGGKGIYGKVHFKNTAIGRGKFLKEEGPPNIVFWNRPNGS